MQIGYTISGLAHAVFVLGLLFGGLFTSSRLPPVAVADVTMISEAELAALFPPAAAPQTVTELDQPALPIPTEAAQDAPEADAAPEIAALPTPEVPRVPETPTPVLPSPLTEADVSDAAPVAPAPPADLDDRPLGPEESAPAPADRVAPIPSAPPEPLVEAAPEVVEQAAPDPIAEAPSAPQEAAAPEEATTEIVTEAEETTNTAPPASPRPQTRPNRPAPQVAETPAEDAPAEEDTTAAAIAAAVAEAAGQSVPQPNPVPSGPPLSSGERDALRVSVQNCWSVDVGSQSANVTVTVAVSMNRDGTVVNNQVRQVEASGGDARAQQAAFEKARRAILRCQRGGFPLPPEKYDHWQEIEMTFNPEGMRLK
ncbi:MAG: hypothetical protein AAFY77_04140 [Pseudomonadota bacterium]